MPTAARPTRWTFFVALLALLLAEVLRVYWIMPFPGSQRGGTVDWAWALHRAIWPVRAVLGTVVLLSAVAWLRCGSRAARIAVSLGLLLLALVVWQANGPMSADVMFRQPHQLRFASREAATLDPHSLVIGITLEREGAAPESRAYPVRFLGHHHQVRDVVAGQPVMATYCTVCRTGRIFRPLVDGKPTDFRLVGMDRWNAMFEDAGTGSWWRQATGEAIVGPLAGKRLEEIPSRQMSWAAWSALHPDTTVMEPDPAFAEEYDGLADFDEGSRRGGLTGRDPGSWEEKSWVVGVLVGDQARALDWNELETARVISDLVGETPILVTLEADGATFHAFDARLAGRAGPLVLETTDAPGRLRDPDTGTTWSSDGTALDGPESGTRLAPLRAYQEFWHSWRTFHPGTSARREGGG
ncbi:MAG: DUF3179 domain-containing (seleno)protein [Thermoanaerobaculia bacterium]